MRALLARVLLLCAGFAVSNTDSHVWALSCGRASAFAPPCGPAASAPRSAPRCQRNPTRSPPAIPPRARAKRRAENSGVGPRPHAGCSPLCCAPGPAAAATDAASAAPGSAAPEAQTWRVPDGVDWVEIWSEVVACAETDAGMKEVASARPLVRVEEVEQWLDQVDEALSLQEKKPPTGLGRRGSALPFDGIADVRPELALLGKGGALDEPALVRLAGSVQAVARLEAHLARPEMRRACPRLAAAWDARAPPLPRPLLADLASSVDAAAGTLAPRAFPALAAARKALSEASAEAEAAAEGGGGRGAALARARVAERAALAESEFARASAAACAALAARVAPHAAAASAALGAAAHADAVAARAALARRLNATRPEVRAEGAVEAREARHPLLALARGGAVGAVGNRLSLSAARPALLVSGPNGGGKSVLLKTFAALALLVAHGCPVPAAPGARVDLFRVRASIGDAQDILGGVSSFSAHALGLADMLALAGGRAGGGPPALLLLDELCSGTDPAAGAALAEAVLVRLVDRGARVVATTHLAPLKALVAADPRFDGAALRWDAAAARPAFRAAYGVVGQSHALRAARRAGLPARAVARAEALLGPEHARAVALLAEAEARAGALQDSRAEARALRAEVAAARRRVAEEEAAVAAGVGRLRRSARAGMDAALRRGWAAVDEAQAEAVRREERAYAGWAAAGAAEVAEIDDFFAEQGAQPP